MATVGEGADEKLVEKIAKNVVQNVKTKEQVTLDTFWSDKPAVLYFMRRFG